ncbi:hypothetical protein [Streptosporangium saharense]|uniref:Uncharacterized protein n=1 Tax=Streptosporangium saharense TaxID=1706840 RepID=A0A7W7QR41_9ACTN|nr:hypothetical protein [Streptosporangium saharense]MBB4918246.1 hypothetical protein [Streptosporangium saharense]
MENTDEKHVPQAFALVRGEVLAYGVTLPGGQAATVRADGGAHGLWNSAQSAAKRLRSDLVWFGDGGG